jgi:hypothetical protein
MFQVMLQHGIPLAVAVWLGGERSYCLGRSPEPPHFPPHYEEEEAMRLASSRARLYQRVYETFREEILTILRLGAFY